ncbi:helix-turn-helix transcriptional regulator [[Phormidium ambiguum] IAM M-71]|uniref:helix-turn-helix transcriptional regulator n=1 Tax=[Phormidium ambiguum] IAM M-71 TaxID=454136 RepID=UPI000A03EFF3|nr:LuxR family transcriptional regulator [Phormidium ambiguum]
MNLPKMIAVQDAPVKIVNPIKHSQSSFSPKLEPYNLFHGILEGFMDGILIFTEAGELLHANQSAKKICQQLPMGTNNSIPEDIWRICESLIESKKLFPQEKIVLESEIHQNNGVYFRLRVRWFMIEQMTQECLLVTIEDKHQSLREIVSSDVHQYDLTPREAEVWLLYKANYSYKEIAEKLYITINTVKKHMKNIHAKRKSMMDEEEI